jgi:hypothetical protein
MNDPWLVVESTLIPHSAFEKAMKRVTQCWLRSLRSPDPICIAVLGESRTGKSRVLEEIRRLGLPSRTESGAVVPIAYLQTPSNPTVKSVAGLLLKELGDPAWDAGTEASKTGRLHDQFRACETRMLMLDEFQHFFDKGTDKVFTAVSDWLKILIDKTKVALVVSGLESCRAVLMQNEQLYGRFLAPAYLSRFRWLDPDDREEFVGILQAFDISMREHFDMPELHTEPMAFRIWMATGGLMGYLAKLLRQLVWNAMDAGARKITLKDFDSAHLEAIIAEDDPGCEELKWRPFASSSPFDLTQERVAMGLGVGVQAARPDPPPPESTSKVPRETRARAKPTLNQVLKASGS